VVRRRPDLNDFALIRVFRRYRARSVEEEVLTTLRRQGPMDLAALGAALRVSPDSVLFFLGKLIRDGKATIASIQAAPEK